MNTIQNFDNNGINNNSVTFKGKTTVKVFSNRIKPSSLKKAIAVPVATVLAYLGIKLNNPEKELEKKQKRLHELFTMLYNPMTKSDILPKTRELFNNEYENVLHDVRALVEPKVDNILSQYSKEKLPKDCRSRLLEDLIMGICYHNSKVVNDDTIYMGISLLVQEDKEAEKEYKIFLGSVIDKALAGIPKRAIPDNCKDRLLANSNIDIRDKDEEERENIILSEIDKLRKEDILPLRQKINEVLADMPEQELPPYCRERLIDYLDKEILSENDEKIKEIVLKQVEWLRKHDRLFELISSMQINCESGDKTKDESILADLSTLLDL